jgi:hypothetical protein
MGLSETILAASIGAAATVSAAMFQLFYALRANKSRIDVRPKRGSTVRSFVAVAALMIVSAVGGYLFSEFRTQRTADDMHSMRDELNAKLQVLAATTERLAATRNNPNEGASTSQPINASLAAAFTSVESVIYAPACQAGSLCMEANSQPTALCGAIPASMQARKFDLYIKGATATEALKADFEQDLGGAKFSGPPIEYPQDENRKAVCVNFLHWSDKPHIATLVLQYGARSDEGPSSVQQTSSAAVVATQSAMPNAHTVSMASPGAMP